MRSEPDEKKCGKMRKNAEKCGLNLKDFRCFVLGMGKKKKKKKITNPKPRKIQQKK